MHSAKKVNGKKLYELAREGAEVERKAHNIEIFDIKLLKFCYPQLKIEVNCSKGTYIRSLAHDIGQKLGVGAYCKELRRTQIGQYHVDLAKKPSDLNFKTIQKYIFDLSTRSFGSKLRQFWSRLTNALF